MRGWYYRSGPHWNDMDSNSSVDTEEGILKREGNSGSLELVPLVREMER